MDPRVPPTSAHDLCSARAGQAHMHGSQKTLPVGKDCTVLYLHCRSIVTAVRDSHTGVLEEFEITQVIVLSLDNHTSTLEIG